MLFGSGGFAEHHSRLLQVTWQRAIPWRIFKLVPCCMNSLTFAKNIWRNKQIYSISVHAQRSFLITNLSIICLVSVWFYVFIFFDCSRSIPKFLLLSECKNHFWNRLNVVFGINMLAFNSWNIVNLSLFLTFIDIPH